ncbi:alanyl-tRNA editing protein, partial [candidate division KSB1 bacterium]|nr:alanyl-tRNA editing protein [candidate division KSB1 bacterium]
MTDLIYQTDSYLQELKAKVTAIQDEAVVFDKTIFYPGGGGQPADAGKIIWNGYVARIKKVKKVGPDVLHWLSGPIPDVGKGV